ncbi:MAG: hypothetical protein JW915_23800 [Chitinispirillaceae bacterium]|nr:hypothetical protein [Chitinispirillaceae bacterium]
MKKKGSLITLLICTIFSTGWGVEVSLSGTVKDASGAAIAQAAVTLASDTSINAVSSADGKFSISNVFVMKRNKDRTLLPGVDGISIKGNRLQYSITLPADHGSITLFSSLGKKTASVRFGKMEPGWHQFVLPDGLAAGFYLIDITIGEVTSTQNLLVTGNHIYVSNTVSGVKNTAWISRSAAAAVDTLIVKKTGFTTTKQAITSYKQTGITIVMKNQPVYAYAATVENTCSDCNVPELPDASKLTKNSKLPNPFKKIDGTIITKKSEWRCRRQEILKQAMKYIYGEKPEPPEVVTGTVNSTKITVHVEDKGKKMDFSADIKLPSTGKAPYPAIISMGYSPVVSKVASQGVATITYNYSKVATPGEDRKVNRNTDFKGPFYDMYVTNPPAGNMMAWAWGASRIVDVLQKFGGDIIDYRRLAVTGCSRDGKDAFAVGLFDERIALTIPQETSLGGIVAYRIADAQCSEKTQYNYKDQIWLCNSFAPFVQNTSQLPIDAHELVATFAPRGLYGIDNSSSSASQMCPQAGNMSFQGGREVYNALGCDSNLTYNSTPTNTSHCIYSENYTKSLTACVNKFLLHQSGETGKIEAGTHEEKKDWIDWTTPTLVDDTDIYETDNVSK